MAGLYDGLDAGVESESKVVAVRLDPATRNAFKAACEANGVSMSHALAMVVPTATAELNARAAKLPKPTK